MTLWPAYFFTSAQEKDSLLYYNMFFLTRREQYVIISFLVAFLIGLAVKQYRSTHEASLVQHSLSH